MSLAYPQHVYSPYDKVIYDMALTSPYYKIWYRNGVFDMTNVTPENAADLISDIYLHIIREKWCADLYYMANKYVDFIICLVIQAFTNLCIEDSRHDLYNTDAIKTMHLKSFENVYRYSKSLIANNNMLCNVMTKWPDIQAHAEMYLRHRIHLGGRNDYMRKNILLFSAFLLTLPLLDITDYMNARVSHPNPTVDIKNRMITVLEYDKINARIEPALNHNLITSVMPILLHGHLQLLNLEFVIRGNLFTTSRGHQFTIDGFSKFIQTNFGVTYKQLCVIYALYQMSSRYPVIY
jgi:hypothetical protein